VTSPTPTFHLDSGTAQLSLHGQDRALVGRDLLLFGVFDGIGSLPQSGLAAACAAAALTEASRRAAGAGAADPVAALIDGLQAAHRAIVADRLGATTAVAVRLLPEAVAWASVGDSRLYVKAGTEPLRQWTADEGVGNRVDNWLGEGLPLPKARVDQAGVFAITLPLTLLLVTDGVTGDFAPDHLSPAELEAAVAGCSAREAAERLIRIARKRDDRTAVVVRCTRPG